MTAKTVMVPPHNDHSGEIRAHDDGDGPGPDPDTVSIACTLLVCSS